MSNFTFIKNDFPELFDDAVEAEQLIFVSSKASAVLMRSVLENAVNWLYENDAKLTRPYRSDLSTLIHEHDFRSLFSFNKLTYELSKKFDFMMFNVILCLQFANSKLKS